MIVKGSTSSGFKYTVNSGIAYDPVFLRAAVKTRKPDADPSERIEGVYEMIDAVFQGDDKQIKKFMKHLAGKSETGRTDIRTLLSEMNEIVNAIQEADAGVKKS